MPDSQPAARMTPAALFRSQRFLPALELIALGTALVMATVSYFIIVGQGSAQQFLKPLVAASLLVANLVPVMAVLILLARRIAKILGRP